jgi:hypothetical protein
MGASPGLFRSKALVSIRSNGESPVALKTY